MDFSIASPAISRTKGFEDLHAIADLATFGRPMPVRIDMNISFGVKGL